MTIRFLRPPFALVLMTVVIGTLAASCPAQSQSDLRRENERLRTQVEDLRRELEALQRDHDALRTESDRLRKLLAAGGTVPPAAGAPAPPPVTLDESEPSASPRALLRTIAEGYEETTTDTEIGRPGDPARTAYLRKLSHWVAKVNRTLKAPIEWHVRIVDPPVSVGGGYTIRLRAVDPVTQTPLGDPFDAYLPRTRVSRLQMLERRGGLGDVLILKGTLIPRVHLNDDRLEAGPFDNPRFVGPFVEFGFAVSATTLLPPEKKEDTASGAGSG